MTLNSFIRKREKSWQQLHALLYRVETRGLKNLDEAELVAFINSYRQASSDLNYLQTHFKESRYTAYLNSLLSRCHTNIHIKEGRFLPALRHFFRGGFPALLQAEKKLFALSTAIFMLTFLFAFFSIFLDAPWAGDLMSPENRELLEESAAGMEESGGVEIPKAAQPFLTGFIATNNIQVGFLAFAGGIICGLGTIYVLAVNGFMLGSFAAVFSLQKQTLLFWTHILPHGIIELTAIFIVATAGLMLGRAMLMPGDLSRKDALRQAGRNAVLVLCGTIPLFIAAAVIEGFFTPAALSVPVKLAFAALTAVALACYLLLPRKTA